MFDALRKLSASDLTPLFIALLLAMFNYVLFYLDLSFVPGNDQIHPMGWWGWFDQGHYLAAARDIAAGTGDPRAHHYPPLYPALGAILIGFSEYHSFLIPNMVLFFLYIWLFMRLFTRHIGGWLALVALVIGLAEGSLLIQWVIPWTSSLSGVLILFAFVLLDHYFVRRDDPDWTRSKRFLTATFFALSVGLLAATRPGDFISMLPIMVVYGAMVLVEAVAKTGDHRMTEIWTFVLAVAAAVLPALAYFAFNLAMFGDAFGGYASSINDTSGGMVFRDMPDKIYSHIIDSELLYGERGADWSTQLPWLYASLYIVPFGLIWGNAIIRALCLTILVQMALVYSFADAVPTGQFRYNNIHYFKWFLPVLPAVFLWFLRSVMVRQGKPRSRAILALSSAAGLFIISLSIVPKFDVFDVKYAFKTSHGHFQLDLGTPRAFDYIDVPEIGAPIGAYSYFDQRVRLDGGEPLGPIRELRATPVEGGMRFLTTRSVTATSVEIQTHKIGDAAVADFKRSIAVKVGWSFVPPWGKRPEAPKFSPSVARLGGDG